MKLKGKIKKGIFVALPCMDGKVEMEFMESLLSLYLRCHKEKIPIIHYGMSGCSLISKGRTDLANLYYYNSDVSHFLFLDVDLKFDPDSIIEMYKSDKDVIGGSYVKKGLNWDKIKKDIKEKKKDDPNSLLINSGEYTLFNLRGKKGAKIMQADYIPTGMLMVKRNVFTKLQMFMEDEYFMFNGNKYYTYFETMLFPLEDGRKIYLSEDYAFCKRVEFAGFDINVMMDGETTHFGRFGYKGNLKKYIEDGNR